MTVIFELGDMFWIEAFFHSHGSVLADSANSFDFNLTKSGDVLAVLGTLQRHAEGSVTVLNNGGTLLSYGQLITGLRVTAFNGDTGSAQVMDSVVIVFMRGRAV